MTNQLYFPQHELVRSPRTVIKSEILRKQYSTRITKIPLNMPLTRNGRTRTLSDMLDELNHVPNAKSTDKTIRELAPLG